MKAPPWSSITAPPPIHDGYDDDEDDGSITAPFNGAFGISRALAFPTIDSSIVKENCRISEKLFPEEIL